MESENTSKVKLFSIFIWGTVFAVTAVMLPAWTRPETGERIFNSPDETANYFFTRLYAEKNTFEYPEPLNLEYGSVLSPRSVFVRQDGNLLPGSFPGLIAVYGWIAKFFGSWIIPYITPFLSIFGLIFLFKLFQRIFSEDIAFFSTLTLMVFPGWWYYNSRGMFHNVLFVNLLIIEIYYLIEYSQDKKIRSLFLSLVFFFLAALTRVSETAWLLPFTVFFLLFSFKKNMFRAWLWILFFFLMLFLTLYFQKFVFGSWLGGYSANIRYGLFPFGVNPMTALVNFFKYSGVLFSWYFYPAVFGLLISFTQFLKLKKELRWYCISFLALSAFLVLYYGSWRLSDHIDPKNISLGTSYVRYWLPISVFSMPFIILFFFRLKDFFRSRQLKIFSIICIIFFNIILSFRLTWTATDESLLSVTERIWEYYLKRELVSQIVGEDAIIVTARSDKIFFPTYRVSVHIDDNKIPFFKKMINDGFSLYYYSHESPEDILKIQKKLASFGMELSARKKIFENEYLYSLINL